ncbi:mechanosensitive ion channel [Synechococcus sp. CS-1329]|uniref:mechanosensitive ion channel family protein n=1 Tax=Synechococcus sp. CS-1329 TaxID=2847975 RepID=UPI00223A92D4|nr:mechanosensitive ion channel domain-containing protein [Synechococcus sp. CS-1329]MCT0218719.1 mechanosensitive ion channel [Synechococcus sp. CS-1329]
MRLFLYEISGWMGYVARPQVLVQVLIGVLLYGSYAIWIRPRLLGRGHRLEFLGSLGLLLALRLSAVLLGWLGFHNGLAHYVAQLFGLWLVLALVRLISRRWYSKDAVERFYRQLVRPLAALVVVGSLINQLDSLIDVGQIPLITLFGEPLTASGIFLILTIPYFLVVVSGYGVVLVGGLLQRLLGFTNGTRVAVELVSRYLVIAMGSLWVLKRIGLNTTAIAAVAGGLSVGLGFGVKEVFSNFVSGLWLLFEGSVRPGEILFIDGDPCEVRSLGLRAAVLWRDRDNAELVIPNQDFFTTTTTTYTGSDRLRRSQVEVSAAYRHDPDVVIRLLESVARSSARVMLQPPPTALLLSYGDSGINYALRFWIEDPMNNAGIKSEVSRAIWHRFSAEGIEIPFPQRVVSMLDPALEGEG